MPPPINVLMKSVINLAAVANNTSITCYFGKKPIMPTHSTAKNSIFSSLIMSFTPAALVQVISSRVKLSLCTAYILWLPSDPGVSQQCPCHSDDLLLRLGGLGCWQPDEFASGAGPTKKPPLGGFKNNLKITYASNL